MPCVSKRAGDGSAARRMRLGAHFVRALGQVGVVQRLFGRDDQVGDEGVHAARHLGRHPAGRVKICARKARQQCNVEQRLCTAGFAAARTLDLAGDGGGQLILVRIPALNLRDAALARQQVAAARRA